MLKWIIWYRIGSVQYGLKFLYTVHTTVKLFKELPVHLESRIKEHSHFENSTTA